MHAGIAQTTWTSYKLAKADGRWWNTERNPIGARQKKKTKKEPAGQRIFRISVDLVNSGAATPVERHLKNGWVVRWLSAVAATKTYGEAPQVEP